MAEPASFGELPDPSARLVEWLDECRKLRSSLEAPDLADGPHALMRQLVQARGTLDRVEEIVASLIRLKGQTREAVLSSKYRLEDAEGKAYQSRAVAFSEYSTGREREAWVATQTTIEKVEFRRFTLLDERVGTALDEAKVVQRGVDAVRRDIDARLRIMTYERQLER